MRILRLDNFLCLWGQYVELKMVHDGMILNSVFKEGTVVVVNDQVFFTGF